MRSVSELRQDIITGDWVVVARARNRRPNEFARTGRRLKPQAKTCPFDRLLPETVLVYNRKGEVFRPTARERVYLEQNWWVQVAPNKYPAFGYGQCGLDRKAGPYSWRDGVGFHDVVITRDHRRAMGLMTGEEVAVVLKAYRDRYLFIKDKNCVEYISIFHNHGREAGASMRHPHSQLIAVPVIPPDVNRSLVGSARYFKKHKKCPHCVMLDYELKDKKRIIHLNPDFAAFCPFVSRQAFEIRIFPLEHRPRFEETTERGLTFAAEALKTALTKIYKGLSNPSYNFFIHTAPVAAGKTPENYHWHMEIVPKTQIWAGFEIGTGIEISTVAPETAAGFLKKIK